MDYALFCKNIINKKRKKKSMTVLVMVGQLLLGLSLLVFVHELGHFLAARAFGIRVEKFYLFFDAWGFKLFSFKIGHTEYGMGWLPLGGYVKIAGMIDESMDKEQMKEPAKPWEFRSKPAWQRLIVMLAGVFVNLVVGVFIFQMLTLFNEKHYLPVSEVNKYGVYASEVGRELGFQTGDKILMIDGKDVERFKDATSAKVLMGSVVTVERDGNRVDIMVPDSAYKMQKGANMPFITNMNYRLGADVVLEGSGAEMAELQANDIIIKIGDRPVESLGEFIETSGLNNYRAQAVDFTLFRNGDTLVKNIIVDTAGKIGFMIAYPKFDSVNYGFVNAFKYGYKDAMTMLILNVKGLGKVVSGEDKFTENVSGPIGIAQIYGTVWDWSRFWFITGMLSLVLAFMNILPIPALDGGHALFTLIEIITRRKLSDKFMEYAQMVGMVLIMALMVFIIGSDILKLFR